MNPPGHLPDRHGGGPPLTRRFVGVLWIFGAAVMLWFLVTVALLEPSGGLHCRTPSGRLQSTQSVGPHPVSSLSTPLRGIDCTIRDAVIGAPSTIWRYGLPLIVGLAVLALALLPGRTIARARRRYVRLTVDAQACTSRRARRHPLDAGIVSSAATRRAGGSGS